MGRENLNWNGKETNQPYCEENRLYGAGSEILANQGMEKKEFVCNIGGCGFTTFVDQKFRREKVIKHALTFHLPVARFGHWVGRKKNNGRNFCTVEGCGFKFMKQRRPTREVRNHFRMFHLKKV